MRNALLARMNPRERSYWQLVPRKNFRLALLLLLLIVGVVALKRSGAMSFSHMFDQFAPPVRSAKTGASFQHLEVRPAPAQRLDRSPGRVAGTSRDDSAGRGAAPSTRP